jgi:branched-chain amino acid transport system permease protein
MAESETTKKISSSKGIMKSIIKQETGFLVFIIIMIALPFVMNLITGTGLNEGITKFWQGQLITFFIMASFAMSYDLLIGYGGILSFGHAASFGGGAYAFAMLFKHWAPNFLGKYRILIGSLDITQFIVLVVVILAVLLISIIIGLIFSATSIRLKGTYFAMLTLAIGQAFFILIKATDFHAWTGADEGIHGIPLPIWINPTQNRLTVYLISLVFLFLSYLLLKRITNSPTGHVIVANRENEDRMKMIGYNPVVYRTIAFVVSSVFAGIAGALYSIWNMGASPNMISAVTTVDALIMTILGGMGTLVGPIIGAGISQVIQQFFYTWFGARWPLVFGLLFMLIVVFLPYGIVGTWRLKQNDLRQGWSKILQLFQTKKG